LALIALDEALAQQAAISQMHKPTSNGLSILCDNLSDPKLQDYIVGTDKDTWSDANNQDDFIALVPPPEFDYLTQWMIKAFLGIFHRFFGRYLKASPNSDPAVPNYSDDRLRLPASIMSTVLSSLLPLASIVVLYLVHDMTKRLVIVGVFTTAFSVLLALLTDIKRSENFAATAG
jgi:hypothetical protein